MFVRLIRRILKKLHIYMGVQVGRERSCICRVAGNSVWSQIWHAGSQ